MALVYIDEAEVWKCPKHPSRRRKSGICPKCLRERLVTLCPDCATARPCTCCPPPPDSSTSSSSTSSSSFSLFAFSRGGSRRDFAPATANAEGDPSLRKSRSVAISFLRSRSRYGGIGTGIGSGIGSSGCDVEVVSENNNNSNKAPLPKVSRSKINFWSVFTVNKSKKCEAHVDATDEEYSDRCELTTVNDNSVMMRSRSVAVGGGNGLAQPNSKHKGWYFPSPIKALRHSKPPRSVAVA